MTEEKVKKKTTRKKKPEDSVSKLNKIVFTFTSRRGLIFIGILSLFSVLEMVYNKESGILNIMKIIIQFLFLMPSS